MVMIPAAYEMRPIAMLIDGDNAQPSLLENVLAETAKYGVVTTRRIYGDWTQQQMGGWKEALHLHAIQPVQQFRYTVGKNATDSALIIDAMDLRGIDDQIAHGDTSHNYRHLDPKPDYILANPPFNVSDWGSELLKNHKRWQYGAANSIQPTQDRRLSAAS